MSGDSTTLTPEQEEAAFAAGFDEDTTAEPTVTPAEQQGEANHSEPGTPAQAEAPAAPEYVQLTKAERDELMGLKPLQEKSFGTAFGKMGGLERWRAEQEAAARAAKEIQSRISPEKIALLREDLPDVADAMEVLRTLPVLATGGPEITKEQIAELVAQAKVEAKQEQAYEYLEDKHEDWQDVIAKPEWEQWKASLDQATRDKLDSSWNARFVARQITAFKQSRKAAPAPAPPADPASARRSRMSAAVTPRGAGGPAAPNPTDDLLAGFNE